MPNQSFETDFSQFNNSVERLLKLGQIRKRDIAQVFRSASRPLVSSAKSGAGRSSQGVVYSRFTSRLHTSGNLARSIKFRVSKRRKFVYYVTPTAWYHQIVIAGSKGGELGKYRTKSGVYKDSDPKPKAAYIPGFGWAKKWRGFPKKPYMERAIRVTEALVKSKIETGLNKLVQEAWSKNG